MIFWRIESPNYESDYKHTYLNGSLDHPFGLPGIECDVCGATWGGSKIFPVVCPQSLRSHKKIKDGWPINRREHARLQEEIMAVLNRSGETSIDLSPGARFQPGFLDIPSRPRADFLWSSISSLVVSERIKEALIKYCPNDIAACPITLRKIGKREANLPPPMPSTGEPEDLIDEVPILKNKSEVGPYFEILILKESDYPPGGTPVSICAGCKRPNVDKSTRELKMTDSMWRGATIFFLATTLQVMITDELKEGLEELQPTNVVFVNV